MSDFINNFLRETKWAIQKTGHTEKDIIFIGSLVSGHSCSWDEFKKLADMEYTINKFHSSVATDLTIVFSDHSRIWRDDHHTMDWAYLPPLIIPEVTKPIKRIITYSDPFGWRSLKKINDMEVDNGSN